MVSKCFRTFETAVSNRGGRVHNCCFGARSISLCCSTRAFETATERAHAAYGLRFRSAWICSARGRVAKLAR
eukprot:11207185-Lingulodinium_polyedra.AAC.1